ncbi:MAG: hypothetical protein QM756_34780 [Polyangiaceae bacterium]
MHRDRYLLSAAICALCLACGEANETPIGSNSQEIITPPSLSCRNIAPRFSGELDPIGADINNDWASYGNTVCNRLVADIDYATVNCGSTAQQVKIDAYGTQRPPVNVAGTQCSGYREELTFYRTADTNPVVVGGGTRTWQFTTTGCKINTNDFDNPSFSPICSNLAPYAPYRVTIRAYNTSNGVNLPVHLVAHRSGND